MEKLLQTKRIVSLLAIFLSAFFSFSCRPDYEPSTNPSLTSNVETVNSRFALSLPKLECQQSKRSRCGFCSSGNVSEEEYRAIKQALKLSPSNEKKVTHGVPIEELRKQTCEGHFPVSNGSDWLNLKDSGVPDFEGTEGKVYFERMLYSPSSNEFCIEVCYSDG